VFAFYFSGGGKVFGAFFWHFHTCVQNVQKRTRRHGHRKNPKHIAHTVVVHDCRRVYLKQNGLFEMFFTRSTQGSLTPIVHCTPLFQTDFSLVVHVCLEMS
jgi:hypothetical protein